MASPSTVITLGFGSFGSVNLLPTLGYGISAVIVVDTPGTTEVGWSFSVPATLLHYEVPTIVEMSFSTPETLLQFDSPMT